MRKVIEWKRLSPCGRYSEVHFVCADDNTVGFSITADGVTWRVVNVPDVGNMFEAE
jgi:hypothetical protein